MFASSRRQQGQSGSEYMMVISAVTIAVVGASFAFVPQFRQGVTGLGNEVRETLGTGEARGAGSPERDGPTGGPTADTRYQRQRQTCIFGFCWGTRETALGGGTGGGGGEVTVAEGQAAELGSDNENIDGAWKSFFQEDVSKAASEASEDLKDQPICGPAIIAALTGRSVDDVYAELENNGRLALVKKETVVGDVVVNTEYTTTGVMSQSQLAAALRDDYGFAVTEKSGANIADVKAALANGQTPIVLLSDSRDGASNAGDFAVVSDIAPGLGVKIDSSTGSYWIPESEFERRTEVMGGKLITAQAPNENAPVALGE